jgi:hypothetical protein
MVQTFVSSEQEHLRRLRRMSETYPPPACKPLRRQFDLGAHQQIPASSLYWASKKWYRHREDLGLILRLVGNYGGYGVD